MLLPSIEQEANVNGINFGSDIPWYLKCSNTNKIK